MNICVFDTEATSLDKPFCYNVGYVILNTDNWEVLARRSFVVEQIWHNLPLFQSAYYADKRPIYISAMRARTTIMDKFGYICQKMCRDFSAFNVEMAFAYNSPFDEKVFNFNCDWFKCINPFDNIPIKDIRGFVHHFIVDNNYRNFCDENGFYSDSGNYSSTAEVVYRYVANDIGFIEAHTALNDAEIEAFILRKAVESGADLTDNYKPFRSIEKKSEKTLTITDRHGDIFQFLYEKIRINKGKTEIKLK